MNIKEVCEKYELKTGSTFGRPGINPSIELVGKNGNSIIVRTVPTMNNSYVGDLADNDLTEGQKIKLRV